MPIPYLELGFAYCTTFCYFAGEVHAHMDWHAFSNPLPSHSCPSEAHERSRDCRCLLPQSKNWRLP